MSILQQKGFSYSFDTSACRECKGNCCRGNSGHVWLSEEETAEICSFLGINRVDFMLRFTDRIDNRLSLKEVYLSGEFACIFFDNKKKECRIYQVRPDQCRRFPFWNYFRHRVDELASECPGILLGIAKKPVE